MKRHHWKLLNTENLLGVSLHILPSNLHLASDGETVTGRAQVNLLRISFVSDARHFLSETMIHIVILQKGHEIFEKFKKRDQEHGRDQKETKRDWSLKRDRVVSLSAQQPHQLKFRIVD